jgi:hypothetical protein
VVVISLAFGSFFLFMPHMVEAQSIVIRPPSISNVVNTPENPPPGYSVNVTANVNAYPRTVAHVKLIFFTSSNRVNRTIQMVLAVGNATTGLFIGIIPPNVSVNGVRITYYVAAIDSSGFKRTSGPRTCVVRPDHTPPAFTGERPPRGYLDIPILNFTNVQVSFSVTDSGSGVRRVFVKYSNSTDPNHNLTQEFELVITEGDRFNGVWSGTLPSMDIGTVIYEAEAIDFSGNVGDSSSAFGDQSYEISSLSAFPPNADIQIVVQDLNLTSRSLMMYFVISANSPNRYAPESFAADIQIESPAFNTIPINVPRMGDFHYQKAHTSQIPIYDVNLWPFDSYSIDIVFRLYTPNLNANNTKVQFFLQGLPSLQFDNSTPHVETTIAEYHTQVTFHVLLSRKPSAIDPIMQAIYAVFFVLGSVALIRPSNLSRRLEVFLGLFTFIVILFYTIIPILQSEGISKFVGQTVPQALLIGLTWSVTLLMVASLAVAYLLQTGRLPGIVRTYRAVFRHVFNFALAFLALVITWYFSEVTINFQYTYSSLGVSRVRNIVVSGLFLPSLVALMLDLWASRRIASRILRGLDKLRSYAIGFSSKLTQFIKRSTRSTSDLFTVLLPRSSADACNKA